MDARAYYSRLDVRNVLLNIAKDREIQIWIGDIRGRRPETINFMGDLDQLIKQGMTSLHISEERWHDPLSLKSGMSKKELDELRKGFDIILDLDSKNLEYSKITASLIIDVLKFNDINNYSIKFSGNKGFHIAIPYETIPGKLHGKETNLLFPELPKIVASYIKGMIKPFLSKKLLEIKSIEEFAKEFNKSKDDLIKDEEFNPFAIVDIDDILISSRHMFRAPYSINEKSGLVSIPIKDIKSFNIDMAKPQNVQVNLGFLEKDNINIESAKNLLLQAFDYNIKKSTVIKEEQKEDTRKFEYKNKIDEDNFPPCINIILKGIRSDGRKRALFILMNFLKSMNWGFKDIENFVLEWNNKNYQPLKENYIRAQLEWHKRQNQKILPANCSNEVYYKSMGLCKPDNFCKFIKNPVNYSMRKVSIKKKDLKKPKAKKQYAKRTD